jgi:hypothetical protein
MALRIVPLRVMAVVAAVISMYVIRRNIHHIPDVFRLDFRDAGCEANRENDESDDASRQHAILSFARLENPGPLLQETRSPDPVLTNGCQTDSSPFHLYTVAELGVSFFLLWSTRKGGCSSFRSKDAPPDLGREAGGSGSDDHGATPCESAPGRRWPAEPASLDESLEGIR